MPGTKTSGRPGGNPNLSEYQFKQKYNWSEPCTARMSLRMPPSMQLAIRENRIVDWQEVARKAIDQAIKQAS